MKILSRFVLGLFLLASAVEAGQWERVDIHLKDAPVVEVLHHFGVLGGAEVEIDPAIHGVISLDLTQVSWPTALDAVCQSSGCRWSLLSGEPRQLRIDPAVLPPSDDPLSNKITLKLKNADARETLSVFGRVAGREVVFEGSISGRVSITLEEVSARTALAAVCEQLRCRIELQEGPPRQLVLHPIDIDSSSPALGTRGLLAEPIDLRLEGVAAAPLFKSFAQLLGVKLRRSSRVDGATSLEIDKQPIEQALSLACAQLHCQWSLRSISGDLTLDIQPDDA